MISLRSELTKKLLNYFFINPEESLYINELSKKLNLDKRNLVKKLKELEKNGILKSQPRGNLKFYSLNQNYPLYEEYKKIILKTVGLEERLRHITREIEGVKEAYIYGSYAKNKMDVHSDIDLLVIGSHEMVILQKKLNTLQKEIDREINSVSMDEREFKKRIEKSDPFIIEVLKGKNIKIVWWNLKIDIFLNLNSLKEWQKRRIIKRKNDKKAKKGTGNFFNKKVACPLFCRNDNRGILFV